MSEFLMAVDLGTTGVKASVFSLDGELRGSASAEIVARFPRPGWMELDAEQIWQSTREVLERSLHKASVSPIDVAALGITNQRSSIVAWDEHVQPLSPMIAWQDTRTAARCRELGEQGFFVSPMMAASKAEWIGRNVPAARDARRRGTLRLGTPDSWLIARLAAGAHLSDHSNASATGLYAYFESRWDEKLLAALDLSPQELPRLVDSAGTFSMTSEASFGAAVPLAGLAADQQASLYGLGCRRSGASKISYGTSASVNTHTGSTVAMGGLGTYPLVAWRIAGESSYCVEGQVVTAGAAVQWLRDGLRVVSETSETSRLAFSVPDAGGVWAVPALQGLGTPLMRSDARAVLGGISRGSGRAHLVRAVLEGIAHRVADAAESVWQACEQPVSTVRVDGGAAANDFLLQCQADLLGIPVERSKVLEGAGLGVALLAGLGVGCWISAADLDGVWKLDRSFEPSIGEDERSRRRAVWIKRLEQVAALEP